MEIYRLRTLLFAGILATGLVVLVGCDGAGAGGSGGSSSGGSSTITWEADGTYDDDPDAREFSIQYSWVDSDENYRSETVAEDEITTLPWTSEKTLEVGTGVSINLAIYGDHTNNMTLTIYENGNTAARHEIGGSVTADGLPVPNPALTHVVGQ